MRDNIEIRITEIPAKPASQMIEKQCPICEDWIVYGLDLHFQEDHEIEELTKLIFHLAQKLTEEKLRAMRS